MLLWSFAVIVKSEESKIQCTQQLVEPCNCITSSILSTTFTISHYNIKMNEEEMVIPGRRRNRAYSDAHALVSISSASGEVDMSMGDENINNKASSSPPRSPTNIGNQINSTKKSNQGHVGGRPRSKSLDLSKIHKKNVIAHHHQHHYKHGQYPLHYGRSNSPSSPKLTGKCWVRKATATSPTPFIPSRAGGATASPSNKEQEHQVGGNVSFPTDPAATTYSPTRQVTDESTALYSAASYDDEMLLSPIMYDDTLTSSPRSSFDTEGVKRRSVCFGETGKPIKPRSAFEQYTSSATPPTATVL